MLRSFTWMGSVRTPSLWGGDSPRSAVRGGTEAEQPRAYGSGRRRRCGRVWGGVGISPARWRVLRGGRLGSRARESRRELTRALTAHKSGGQEEHTAEGEEFDPIRRRGRAACRTEGEEFDPIRRSRCVIPWCGRLGAIGLGRALRSSFLVVLGREVRYWCCTCPSASRLPG